MNNAQSIEDASDHLVTERGDKSEVSLNLLLDAFTDIEATNDDRKQRILDIGLNYLSMQSGIIGSALGKKLEILRTSGTLAETVPPVETIAQHSDMFQAVLDTSHVLAIDDFPAYRRSNNLTKTCSDIRSYIGTQIQTTNGPVGTISYSSNQTRDTKFNGDDMNFIDLLARRLGAIIGHEEQLEFLSLQSDHYRNLCWSTPAMMMLCDQDGLILSTSNRLAESIGIESQGIPGKRCHQLFEDRDSASITEALLQGNVDLVPLNLQRNNQKSLDVELSSSVKNMGTMQGIRMIVLADVSERNEAIEKFAEQNEKLKLANESLNQFTSIASHDLQEPLNKMQGFSEFLLEDLGTKLTQTDRYHIEIIQSSAKRMKILIQNLLNFSRAVNGGLTIVDIDLNKLVSEVISDLELRITESEAKITTTDLPTVQADWSLTRQLFTNLVSNGIKYRDYGRDVLIDIACKSDANALYISISDNGIGFDQALKSKIFEPFSRLNTEKKYEGNGLGLAICATVCEKHGWTILADSQLEIGSVFTIAIKKSENNVPHD